MADKKSCPRMARCHQADFDSRWSRQHKSTIKKTIDHKSGSCWISAGLSESSSGSTLFFSFFVLSGISNTESYDSRSYEGTSLAVFLFKKFKLIFEMRSFHDFKS